MADLVVLLVLAAVVVLVVAVAREARRSRAAAVLPARPSPQARWHAGHHSTDGVTIVTVDLYEPAAGAPLLERREVGRVDDGDPAYDRRLAALMDTARERAVLLDLNRE